VLLSLVASAKRHGLDPFEHLRDLFVRLPAKPTNIEGICLAGWECRRLKAPAGAGMGTASRLQSICASRGRCRMPPDLAAFWA